MYKRILSLILPGLNKYIIELIHPLGYFLSRMGKKVTLSAVFLCLTILSIVPQTSYERGERLYLEGNYPLALDAFDAFLRASPDSPLVADAQFRRAQILFHLKRYREADELFQRIEVRYPSTQYYPSLPFWSGMAAYGLKDFKRAQQLFMKYLRGSPPEEGRRRALLYLAFSRKESGLLKEAKEALLQLFTAEYLNSPDPEALVLYGSIALASGDVEGLLSLYGQVQRLKLPEPAQSRFLLFVGEGYFRHSLFREAMEAFTSVSPDLQREKLYAWKRTIQCYAALHEPQRIPFVLEEGRQWLKNDSSSLAELWELGGRGLFNAGEYESSIRYLEILRGGGIGVSEKGIGILAESYRRLGDLGKAYTVLSESPQAPDLLFLRGEIEAQRGQWSEAEQTFKGWIASFPASSLRYYALYLLAWVMEKQGRLKDALTVTEVLPGTGLLPEEALPFLRFRAILLGKASRESEALNAWETYLGYRPEDMEGRIERLRLLLAAKRSSAVRREADTLLQKELPPRLKDAVRLLQGVALLEEAQFAEASTVLEQVASRNKQLPAGKDLWIYATFYLGWAYYRLGRFTASLEVYRSLLKEGDLAPELRERAVYYGGWSAYTLKQFELAYTLLESFPIGKGRPLWSRVWFLRAKTLYMLGRKREAQEAFRTLFSEEPKSALADNALYEYANIFVEFEQPDQASEAYTILFEQYPESLFREQALFKRGEIFYAANRFQEAKEAFTQYRSLLPKGSAMDRTLFWEGMASYKLGQPYAALVLWERIIMEYPKSVIRSEALVQASTVLSEVGDYPAALRYLRQLREEYPAEASSELISRRIRELELLQAGATEREAVLKVRLEEARGVTTERGRKIALELVKLYLYEMGGKRAEEEAERWLGELLGQGEGKEVAEAKYLRGDLSRKRGNLLEAAMYYGEAASSPGADTDLITRALYQGLKTLALAGRREEAARFLDILQKRFPESPWTHEGKKALGLP